MAQRPEDATQRRSNEDISNLPPLQADRIPDDVLAQQDAEKNVVNPGVHDPLAHLSGVSEDVLTELDAAERTDEGVALVPTDEEVIETPPI